MCDPVTLSAIGSIFGTGTAATTAAGATGLASTLQGVGTALAIGGTVASGISTYKASKATVAQIEQQKKTEGLIAATQEERTRQSYRTAMAQQRAELAARGVSLDSPTAIFLGQTAAREMTFEAQSIRSGNQATQTELTAQQSAARARGTNALFKGGLSGAGMLLNNAPDLWPELLA